MPLRQSRSWLAIAAYSTITAVFRAPTDFFCRNQTPLYCKLPAEDEYFVI